MYYCYESDYVKVLANDELTPLMYCIYQIVSDWSDLERFLKGILGHDPVGLVGGDPGWQLAPENAENNKIIYYAWVDEYLGVNPNEGYFEEKIVKKHIKCAFENMMKLKPDRRLEIEKIFIKYNLY